MKKIKVIYINLDNSLETEEYKVTDWFLGNDFAKLECTNNQTHYIPVSRIYKIISGKEK